MHYYQHHIGDFIKATSRLSDGQAMGYLRLLWKYYEDEKPIIDDIELLAFQLGSSPEDIRLILKSFFVLQNDGWHQVRCDAEIADFHEFCAKQRANGLKGGRPKAKNKPIGNPTETQREPTGNPMETLTTTHYPEPSIKPSAPNGFDLFWNAYPKKKSKGDAEKVWKKLKPNAELQTKIFNSINRLKATEDWAKQNGQFIPYPATWLNAQGWDDEVGGSTQPDWRKLPNGVYQRFFMGKYNEMKESQVPQEIKDSL